MRILLTTLFVVAATGIAWTQSALSAKAFHNSLEKTTWEAIHKKEEINPLTLFLMAEPTANAFVVQDVQQDLDEIINIFENRFQGKPIQLKQARQLFNRVQNKYLHEFDERANFKDLLERGSYNCVTAVAFYSLILKGLGISHTIKLAPTHVFLEIEIADQRILWETTDAIGGFILKDEELTKKLTRYQADDGQGSRSEGPDLFLQQAKTIQLHDLAGVQYFNLGINHFESLDYSTAISLFQKSKVLYPDFRCDDAIRSVLVAQLLDQNQSTEKLYEALTTFAELADGESDLSVLVRGFNQYSDQQLHLGDDPDGFRTAYFDLYQKLISQDSRLVLQCFYYFEIGRYYFEKQDYIASERLFKKAYQLAPNMKGLDNALITVKKRIAEHQSVAQND